MSMDCKTFESKLADAIGEELGEADRAAFASHAAGCERCGREYHSLAATMHLVRNRIGAVESSTNRHIGGAARSRWAIFRYAALIALAFVAGYGLRGSGAAPAATSRSGEDERVITVHEQLAVVHRRVPEASSFAKSILAVLGPGAAESR